MRAPLLARLLIPRIPFYYGWIILGAICFAGFARQGPAVAVLSIFVTPMGRDLGWSATSFGIAVSLGGVLAAVVSPWIGGVLDRHGARLLLCFAVLGAGFATLSLSLVGSLPAFYLLFCFARMIWAGPYELGLYGALNSWFVARRALAASVATVAQLAGLVAFPLIAHFAMQGATWRAGWVAVGLAVISIGFVPVWLLLVRRPEDVGLAADPAKASAGTEQAPVELNRAQAMRTRAFWLLALYTVLVFPCQAGVSLFQAAHMIERGIDPTTVATIVSVFSLVSAIGSFGVGLLPRRLPLRYTMAVSSALLCAGALVMIGIRSALHAYLGAGVFGLGIGLMLTLLPVVWADYFGRASYGAIRGVALSMQVLAQASGPVIAGALRDAHGDYTRSLTLFAVLSGAGIAAVLAAGKPEANRR